MLVIKLSNVVDHFAGEFLVHYRMRPFAAFREPALLVCAWTLNPDGLNACDIHSANFMCKAACCTIRHLVCAYLPNLLALGPRTRKEHRTRQLL